MSAENEQLAADVAASVRFDQALEKSQDAQQYIDMAIGIGIAVLAALFLLRFYRKKQRADSCLPICDRHPASGQRFIFRRFCRRPAPAAMSVCMLTGHRRLPSDGGELRCRLDAYIDVLCRRGVTEFLSGGALGFDLLGAEAVLYAQRAHPQVTLTDGVLPCRNQSHRYSAAQRLRYEGILGPGAEGETGCQTFIMTGVCWCAIASWPSAPTCVCAISHSRAGARPTLLPLRRRADCLFLTWPNRTKE